jgi:metal-dependent amidase/aminoacylase/carboxypeptidase family protein
MTDVKKPTEILAGLDEMLPELEAIYKDIHAHPELSMQEIRTAGIAADHLKKERIRGHYGSWEDRCCRPPPKWRWPHHNAAR